MVDSFWQPRGSEPETQHPSQFPLEGPLTQFHRLWGLEAAVDGTDAERRRIQPLMRLQGVDLVRTRFNRCAK